MRRKRTWAIRYSIDMLHEFILTVFAIEGKRQCRRFQQYSRIILGHVPVQIFGLLRWYLIKPLVHCLTWKYFTVIAFSKCRFPHCFPSELLMLLISHAGIKLIVWPVSLHLDSTNRPAGEMVTVPASAQFLWTFLTSARYISMSTPIEPKLAIGTRA